MKIFAYLFLFFLLVSASCRQQDYPRLLAVADSLMDTRPDSAWQVLRGISSTELNRDADRAYYALLLTQVRDKNFIEQKNDSLIRVAVEYYERHEDVVMQARAYYLWGGFYRDKNLQADAVEKYLKAAYWAEKAGCRLLLGRIYNNIGYLYYWQKLYDDAYPYFQKTAQLGITLNDTNLYAEALLMQGKIRLNQNDYVPAERKLLLAQSIMGNKVQIDLQMNIVRTLSLLYSRTKDKTKALQYAKHNIGLQTDTLHCYYAYLTLGEAYFQTGQYDSAAYYIYKSLGTSDYGIKADAYMRLADIARQQGNVPLSLEMEILYSSCKDSLEIITQHQDVLKVGQKINEQIQYMRHEKTFNKRILGIVVSMTICICIILLWLRRRHCIREHKLQVRENILHEECVRKKEQLEQNRVEIAAMQDKINQQNINEEQKQILMAELDSLHEQHADMVKKMQRYSDVIQEIESTRQSDFAGTLVLLRQTELYAKMERICAYYKEFEGYKEHLTVDDQNRLLCDIDCYTGGFIVRLKTCCPALSEDDLRFCALHLLGLSVQQIAVLLEKDRSGVYKRQKRILRNCFHETGDKKFEEVLKSI